MQITFPNGCFIDTTGAFLEYDTMSYLIKLNGNTVYTPGSPFELNYIMTTIGYGLAFGQTVFNFWAGQAPLITSVSPNPVTYNAGQQLTVNGHNFIKGGIVAFNYTGWGGGGSGIVPASRVAIDSYVNSTQFLFTMPVLANNTGTLIITYINPDTTLCNFTLGVV